MTNTEARRQAETRRRFEELESRVNDVHYELFTLWGLVEEQRRKIEALQKKLATLTRVRHRQQSYKRR